MQGVAQIFIDRPRLPGSDPIALFEGDLFIGVAAFGFLDDTAASRLFKDLELEELFRAKVQKGLVGDKELQEQPAIPFENSPDLGQTFFYLFLG